MTVIYRTSSNAKKHSGFDATYEGKTLKPKVSDTENRGLEFESIFAEPRQRAPVSFRQLVAEERL